MSPTPYRLVPGPLVPRPPHPWGHFWRIWGSLLVIFTVSGSLFWKYQEPILIRFAMLFRVDERVHSDALVLLLGGLECRPAKVAELYREGLAGQVILCSGSPPHPGFMSESAASIRSLLIQGVPGRNITLVRNHVSSTRDEAMAILPVAKAKGWKSLTVVTTSFHTHRARWIFQKIFRGSGIEIHMAAATDPEFDESNWFIRDESVLTYFDESIKTVVYWLRY